MDTTKETKNNTENATQSPKPDLRSRGGSRARGGSEGMKRRGRDRRPERPKSEYEQKMLTIRRVARVAAGGRRFSFSVAMAIGNRNGLVGVGIGKAGDTALAIEKAVKDAKKQMIKVPITKDHSIPHEIITKYSSAKVILIPAPGKGLVAGSAVRDVLTLAGYRGVVGKIISGSKNKLNIARATVKALTEINPPKDTASKTKSEKK